VFESANATQGHPHKHRENLTITFAQTKHFFPSSSFTLFGIGGE